MTVTVPFWGSLIEELRRAEGYSQRALAERVPCNRKSLRALEKHISVVDVEMLEKLLDFFGYDLEAIKRGSEVRRFLDDNIEIVDPERRSKLARQHLMRLSPKPL